MYFKTSSLAPLPLGCCPPIPMHVTIHTHLSFMPKALPHFFQHCHSCVCFKPGSHPILPRQG